MILIKKYLIVMMHKWKIRRKIGWYNIPMQTNMIHRKNIIFNLMTVKWKMFHVKQYIGIIYKIRQYAQIDIIVLIGKYLIKLSEYFGKILDKYILLCYNAYR